MEILLPLIISLSAAYLLGAIPTAYIFGRVLKNLDIREHGSGNMGATNAFRVLGKGPGTAVLIIDILKGVIPVAVIAPALGLEMPWALVIVGLVAVCGHNWTVFLGFKGGKGIATTLGVLIGLTIEIPGMRVILLCTVGIWLVLFLIFGYVSLASIVAAVALPILMIAFNAPFPVTLLAIILSVFIVIRHRPNLKRLLKGQENRVIIFKKKSS